MKQSFIWFGLIGMGLYYAYKQAEKMKSDTPVITDFTAFGVRG